MLFRLLARYTLRKFGWPEGGCIRAQALERKLWKVAKGLDVWQREEPTADSKLDRTFGLEAFDHTLGF